ncbi:MAG: AraC family transcriptional regulator [Candidatus Moranbacteria bacterium]|nr:AraC family transcriptional regulator [Candidatus Moranbacteria bacterium]
MLNVKFYKPKENLSWLVRKFETIKTSDSLGSYEDFFIPRPDVALVFHFADLPLLLSENKSQLKPIFIAPIRTKPLQMQILGALDCFIVICNVTSLSKVLGLNFFKISYGYLEVKETWLNSIFNDLVGLKSCQERIECFSNHIQHLFPNGYTPDNIDGIYLDILKNSLQKPLSNIIKNAPCSVSSLQRNFIKRTGVSMKKLIRIARVNAIFEKMLEKNQFDYKEVLFESQYYDQSHFIKDFKDITGSNPSTFFRQNSDLCKILSGIHNSQNVFNS